MKETLEEAYLSRLEDCLSVDFEDGVKLGVKWQKEKSYSEEEVLNMLYKHTEDLLSGKKIYLEEWFNQNKKK